jgi:hypothetical protein
VNPASSTPDPQHDEDIEPGGDVFSEADLEPTGDERRALRRQRIDVGAAIAAVIATGSWAGGMVAMGACAAPMVFQHVPAPLSGMAMGAAFARFDGLAIGCAVVLLGAELVRTLLSLRRRRGVVLGRLRRYGALLLASGTVYTGAVLTPTILRLYEQGARRNVGADGSELERIHNLAETIGKVSLPLALAVIALHVVTLVRGRPDDEEEQAPAPLPPGPRKA